MPSLIGKGGGGGNAPPPRQGTYQGTGGSFSGLGGPGEIDYGNGPGRIGDELTPQPSATWIIPEVSGGRGPLAGLLGEPPRFLPFDTEEHARSGKKIAVFPLFDDYGNVWLVLSEGYDPAELAGFNRSAGKAATPLWEEISRYNLACLGWRPEEQVAAVVPDTSDQVVLPDPGQPYMIIGNVPFTLPAIPEKQIPAIRFRCTCNRWLRFAYLTNNFDTRQQWLATNNGWGALWEWCKIAFKFIVDFVTFRWDVAVGDIETMFDGDWADGGLSKYIDRMKDVLARDFPALRSGESSGQPGEPNAPPPPGGIPSFYLALGAVALIVFLVLLARSGGKGT